MSPHDPMMPGPHASHAYDLSSLAGLARGKRVRLRPGRRAWPLQGSGWIVDGREGGTVSGCVAAVLLLGLFGCSPLRPYDAAPAQEGFAAVLWTRTHYRKSWWSFERATYATVARVDGVENVHWRPMNLPLGRHSIEVRYDRETYLCGYLGCVNSEQDRKSFELTVEGGHSYMPFARRFCDKDWIGILDTGRPARIDIATWRSVGDWAFGDLTSVGAGHAVVAGEGPPVTCGIP